MFKVTKRFSSGTFKGVTVEEVTSVEFKPVRRIGAIHWRDL